MARAQNNAVPGDAGALELSGPGVALLDDPLDLRARGAGEAGGLVWRARLRDDRDRIWRAVADRPQDLATHWRPSKPGGEPVAALSSLRPVTIDIRVEAPDGRAASRTFTRQLLGEGVRVRRWRDGLAATLHRPPGDGPFPALILDATAGPDAAAAATLAAPLLASRGVLAVAVTSGELDTARERLAAVPAAAPGDARLLTDVPIPPGVGVRDDTPEAAAERAAGWDALISSLGATPRAVPGPRGRSSAGA